MMRLPNADFLNGSVKDPYLNVDFNPDLGKRVETDELQHHPKSHSDYLHAVF